MIPKTNDKDINKLIKKAAKFGWSFEIKGGGHIKGKSPCGQFMTVISVSPKSKKAFWDTQKIFRKSGVQV